MEQATPEVITGPVGAIGTGTVVEFTNGIDFSHVAIVLQAEDMTGPVTLLAIAEKHGGCWQTGQRNSDMCRVSPGTVASYVKIYEPSVLKLTQAA